MSPALVGPLVSVAALAAALEDPGLRVVDCRWYLGRPGDGRLAYDAGHLPGAIHLDIDTDLTAPTGPGRHPLPDPAVFAARLADVGIGDEHTVVAYDDVGGWVAARLWWMLDDLGHRSVAVLDGGLQAWTTAGLPLTTEEPAWPSARLSLRGTWGRVMERDELRVRPGHGPAARCKGRGPVPRRDRADRCLSRSHPDGDQCPDRREPRGRWALPRRRASWRRATASSAPMARVARSSSRAAAAYRRRMTPWRYASPACRTPSSTPGSYSDWTQQGLPVATGDDPGDPPPDSGTYSRYR